jgi:hypothetical protein
LIAVKFEFRMTSFLSLISVSFDLSKMNSPIEQHFKRLDVFQSKTSIISFNKNLQNTLFIVVNKSCVVSLFSKEFKLLCKIDDFLFNNETKILSTFSPDGDYLIICGINKPGFLVIFEIETQRKFFMEEQFAYFPVYFIPYTNFIIIKTDNCMTAIPFASKKLKKEMKIEQINPTKKVSSFVVDFPRGVIYLLLDDKKITWYNINSTKLIGTKEISGMFCSSPKISFLMKNGNIFVSDGFYQHVFDKDCKNYRKN